MCGKTFLELDEEFKLIIEEYKSDNDTDKLEEKVNDFLQDDPLVALNRLTNLSSYLAFNYIDENNLRSFNKLKALINKFPSIMEYSKSKQDAPLLLLILGSDPRGHHGNNQYINYDKCDNRALMLVESFIVIAKEKNISINFNIRNEEYNNNTLLHSMIANDYNKMAIKFLELLKKHGYIESNQIKQQNLIKYNIDAADEYDNTPLILLIARKYFQRGKLFQSDDSKLIDCLIKSGADITITDSKGNNLLHIALLKRDIETVDSLLENPDFTKLLKVSNKEGKTPLDYLSSDIKYSDAEKQIDLYYCANKGEKLPKENDWNRNRKILLQKLVSKTQKTSKVILDLCIIGTLAFTLITSACFFQYFEKISIFPISKTANLAIGSASLVYAFAILTLYLSNSPSQPNTNLNSSSGEQTFDTKECEGK